jgi:hypothetical protein
VPQAAVFLPRHGEEMGHCFPQNPQISPLIFAVDFYGMSFEVRIFVKDLGQ